MLYWRVLKSAPKMTQTTCRRNPPVQSVRRLSPWSDCQDYGHVMGAFLHKWVVVFFCVKAAFNFGPFQAVSVVVAALLLLLIFFLLFLLHLFCSFSMFHYILSKPDNSVELSTRFVVWCCGMSSARDIQYVYLSLPKQPVKVVTFLESSSTSWFNTCLLIIS